jgi:hypothetical protein
MGAGCLAHITARAAAYLAKGRGSTLRVKAAAHTTAGDAVMPLQSSIWRLQAGRAMKMFVQQHAELSAINLLLMPTADRLCRGERLRARARANTHTHARARTCARARAHVHCSSTSNSSA